MSYYSGRDGSLVYNNKVIAKVSEWSISASVEALPTTTLGKRNESYVPGNMDASGGATILYYADAPVTLINKVFRVNTVSTDPEIFTMKLQYSTKTINFNCVITQASLSCKTGDVMQASIDFKVTDGFSALVL